MNSVTGRYLLHCSVCNTCAPHTQALSSGGNGDECADLAPHVAVEEAPLCGRPMSSVEVRQGPTLYGLDKELAAKVPCLSAVQTARRTHQLPRRRSCSVTREVTCAQLYH